MSDTTPKFNGSDTTPKFNGSDTTPKFNGSDTTPKFNGSDATPDYVDKDLFNCERVIDYTDVLNIKKINITWEDRQKESPKWVELAEKINEIIDLLSNKI